MENESERILETVVPARVIADRMTCLIMGRQQSVPDFTRISRLRHLLSRSIDAAIGIVPKFGRVGKAGNTIDVVEGGSLIPTTPTKTGYEFGGWRVDNP